MSQHHVTAIGLEAAFCTTFAFPPQAIETWRKRHFAGDVSDFLNRDRTVADLWPAVTRYSVDRRRRRKLMLALTILGFKVRHG
jgi:hypothetical protein